MSKSPLEQLGECQKMIEGLGAGRELHQKIHITVRLGIAPQDGAE